ncbi:MFS transporter [Catellatospora sp. TT07R-123]|uniref:MFS transporter n=1 Tax=Catellatospora sp. TT07R-123 TaxID=2733863 RepID=UPI001B1E96F2|nr:MFS transporter [Catellatospora sp. TT07R-123]GHJ44244.1 MFS transporter [Catellatospora sp. TT07R-123]
MVADTRTANPPPRASKPLTAAGFILFILLGALFTSLGALLPVLRAEFGMGATAGSELVSVFRLGSLVATIACGLFARRLDGSRTMSVLVVLAVGATVTMALAPTWAAVVAAAVVAGVGFGGLVLYLNTAFAIGYGERSMLMVNLLSAAFMVGCIIGPLAVGMLTGLGRHLLLGVAGLALLCWPARGLARLVPTRGSGVPGRPEGSAHRCLPLFAAFALVALLLSVTETGIGTWEATHLVAIGFPVAAAAALTGLFWAGHAVGRATLPFLSGRGAPGKLVVTCTLLAAGALAGACVPGLAPYAYAVAGILLGPVIPTLLAWLATATPAPQSANAIMLTALMVGSAGSPALISSVIGDSSGAVIPLTLSLLALATTIAVLLAGRAAAARIRDLRAAPAESALFTGPAGA